MRGLFCLVGCLVVLLAGQTAQGSTYLDRFDVPADAEYVGSEECAMCHEDIGEFYTSNHSPHAWELGLAVPGRPEAVACEACHGPGSLHVDEGGDGWILGLDQLHGLGDAGRAAMCTQCHTDMDLHFADSPHAGTEISCADCHGDQTHFGADARPAGDFRNRTEFCLQCHPAVAAQFRLPSRHRVLEGGMSCSDCHDHHRGMDMTSFDGLNQTCLSCHAQMSGPFVFEHAGVDGEECLNCHRPHGSQHQKMLAQDGNGLCLQCHFETGFRSEDNWNVGGQAHAGLLTGEARCYDCHREIHGSNVSPSFTDR